MKFNVLLLLFFSGFTFSQIDGNISTIRKRGGNDAERYFKITGDESSVFVNQLFHAYPKVRRDGYIHHFRQINIAGITGSLTLRIHEGIAGRAQEGYSYFNTFTSEKYRKQRLHCMTEQEIFGVLIYVKKSHSSYIASDEEATVFVNYIKQLISV